MIGPVALVRAIGPSSTNMPNVAKCTIQSLIGVSPRKTQISASQNRVLACGTKRGIDRVRVDLLISKLQGPADRTRFWLKLLFDRPQKITKKSEHCINVRDSQNKMIKRCDCWHLHALSNQVRHSQCNLIHTRHNPSLTRSIQRAHKRCRQHLA